MVSSLLLLALVGPAMAGPAVVTVEDADPTVLAADDAKIYWATRDAVRMLAVGGSEPVTIAEIAEVRELVVTRVGVVAATEDTLWVVGPTMKPRRLYRGAGRVVRALVGFREQVYVGEHPRPRGPGDLRAGRVLAIDVPSGRVRVVARNVDGPIALATAGPYLYWPSALEIWRFPLPGGKPELFLRSPAKARAPVPPSEAEKPQPRPRIHWLAVDDHTLFWKVDDLFWKTRLGVEPAPETAAEPPRRDRFWFEGRTLYRAE